MRRGAPGNPQAVHLDVDDGQGMEGASKGAPAKTGQQT